MNRRSFLKQTSFGTAGFYLSGRRPRTQHLIFIVNGAARKKDYYEDESLSPNIRRLADEGFVFEEDHCERISSHDLAFAELLSGRESSPDGGEYPNIFDYLNCNYRRCAPLGLVPEIMRARNPRILVCRETAHDTGHYSYEDYLRAVKTTDAGVGRVFNWIKNHPEFSQNTAIVIRPEFGRDDEVNDQGQLHHSQGFYYTHRVASIFWGPDFNQGVDRKTVINRLDITPTLASLFGVNAVYAQGQLIPGLVRRGIEGP